MNNILELTQRADQLVRNKLYDHDELSQIGLSRNHIFRLVREGTLLNPVRGVFHHKDRDSHELDSLALIAKRYPESLFVLYTAAEQWDMNEVATDYVWVSIPSSRGKSISMGVDFERPVRTLLCEREIDLTVGVTEACVLGQRIKLTTPERTLVDIWRMSTLSGEKHANRIAVREESVFQSFEAYLKRSDGSLAQLAEVAEKLDLSDRLKSQFFSFAKTYVNAFEAQQVI